MYYLSKFCRICIKTGVKLFDIDTVDVDQVTLSEKLELCTEMVINRESLSTEICYQCIKKLRTSYNFQNTCKQSTKILQGYLTELLSASNKINPDSFVNSELRVTIDPIQSETKKRRKKRISKGQRCSLLKKLLQNKRNKKSHTREKVCKKRRAPKPKYRGLRNIIDFTKSYDFGYKIDNNHNCQISDSTPLSKLTNFTNTFFVNNFTEFRNTILYIIENKDCFSESDDDEEMFESLSWMEHEVKCEELVIEPDIKIKTELDYDDTDAYSCNYYVETSYSDSESKKENFQFPKHFAKQEDHVESEPQSSVQMLDKLVGNLGHQRRSLSRYSVRCRTRGNPYINPTLQQQFQLKSFQCDKCNRYFKSPGYLKAHLARLHS